MKIAVLGTGRVGVTLGGRWSQAGHEVTFGSRQPASERAADLLRRFPGVRVGGHHEAVTGADVVLLATPWPSAEALVRTLDLAGRVVVDCINPLNAEFTGLALGHTTSAAERIAEWSGARVVKAFNTVSAATMADPNYGGQPATLFYCGDDQAAKDIVGTLARQLGFDPVDAGGLAIARHLEPLAMLYIHLAVRRGWGANCAIRMVKR